MLSGAHVIVYSENAEADRAFLRDILELDHVDAGDGWLIFALPPSEAAVHPTMPGATSGHELYFMVEDITAFIAEMKRKEVICTPVQDLGWGILTAITLPGGGDIGVYQPRHETAHGD